MKTESVIIELKENNNYQLEDISNQSLTPCVVLNIIDNKIQYCNKTLKQRPLAQLIDIWKIDGKIITNIKAKNKLYTLGVYMSHYNYDQNTLHDQKLK